MVAHGGNPPAEGSGEDTMYEEFILRKTEKGNIQGYEWPLEKPRKVVCIVHGIGEYGGRYDRVAEAFRKHGMSVLALDLRGHGGSLGRRGHCAPRKDVLDDVSSLIELAGKRYPGVPLVLYGHSMGGNIALDYRFRGLLNDRPAGYIISAPWIRLVRPIPKALYRTVKLLAGLAPSFTIGSSIDESLLGNPEQVKPFVDNPRVHTRISLQCAVDGFETGLAMENGQCDDDRRAADIPMLLMHGSQDGICDIEGSRRIARRLKERGDKVTYIEWEGLYHEIHNGSDVSTGDEVIARTVDWTEKLPG